MATLPSLIRTTVLCGTLLIFGCGPGASSPGSGSTGEYVTDGTFEWKSSLIPSPFPNADKDVQRFLTQTPMFDALNFAGSDSAPWPSKMFERIDVFLTPSDSMLSTNEAARSREAVSLSDSVASTDASIDTLHLREQTEGSSSPKSETPAAAGPSATPRHIIYTAEVQVVVEDFAATHAKLQTLVGQFRGYVSKSDVNSERAQKRAGTWQVRIPVDQFDSFVEAVVNLGVPEVNRTNAHDVTEEFVDLAARLSNKRELERRILKLLEERSGNIKDVITVEGELGRIREEIERMEGRLRYLKDVTAMTSVTVSIREEKNYVPPQDPTFATQIGKRWSGSLDSLQGAGRAVVLLTVSSAPWLVVVALLGTPVVWIGSRRLRRAAG